MTTNEPEKRTDFVYACAEEDGSWTLRDLKLTVASRHLRLIDVLYERQRLWTGETPPFGRWLCYWVEEVEPLRFDGETDEQMQSEATMKKTLHIRDCEYDDLLDELEKGTCESAEDGYPDELETSIRHLLQQRPVAPYESDSDDSSIVTNHCTQVDNEQDLPCAPGDRPFYKRHPIVFWTSIGALLTVLGFSL
jgi:hypothetical protein